MLSEQSKIKRFFVNIGYVSSNRNNLSVPTIKKKYKYFLYVFYRALFTVLFAWFGLSFSINDWFSVSVWSHCLQLEYCVDVVQAWKSVWVLYRRTSVPSKLLPISCLLFLFLLLFCPFHSVSHPPRVSSSPAITMVFVFSPLYLLV